MNRNPRPAHPQAPKPVLLQPDINCRFGTDRVVLYLGFMCGILIDDMADVIVIRTPIVRVLIIDIED
jgi:hypothetical protein